MVAVVGVVMVIVVVVMVIVLVFLIVVDTAVGGAGEIVGPLVTECYISSHTDI